MDCGIQPELGSREHLSEVYRRAREDRVPVGCTFDLTHRCNFRCIHCLVGHETAQSRSQAGELTTEQAKSLLKEVADAGCLFLLMSGGEPLLRNDFADIYVEARRLGMVVTVFSNGSLVTAEHVEVFREFTPRMVEITLYGATEATFDRITGTPGSYQRAWRGIERLLDGGIAMGLKSMIMRDNVDEIPAMEARAQELGVTFRLDPVITPRLDGDLSPLLQRVDPEQAAEIELSSHRRRTELTDYLSREYLDAQVEPTDRAYRCSAGTVSCHIDPQGFLRPCVMSEELVYNTTTLGYLHAWRAAVAACDQGIWEDAGLCSGCPDIALCGYCAGLFALEQVTPSRPPEYLCRLGRARRQALLQNKPEVVAHVGID